MSVIIAAEDPFVPWATAILGAVLGVLLTSLYAWYRKRCNFIDLLHELADELDVIRAVCRERAHQPPVVGPIYPPLPTEAWRLLVSTGDLGTLDRARVRSLRILYSDVVAANHAASQWCCLLQIARLSTDEAVTSDFNDAAARTMIEPCATIYEKIEEVIGTLKSAIRENEQMLTRLRLGRAR